MVDTSNFLKAVFHKFIWSIVEYLDPFVLHFLCDKITLLDPGNEQFNRENISRVQFRKLHGLSFNSEIMC